MADQATNASGSGDKIIVLIDPDIEDLIPGFFEFRRKDIHTINAALSNGDFERIRVLGHGMKGAGGGYGFAGITEIGRALEAAAKNSDSSAIQSLVADLENYLERVEVVYEQPH